MASDYGLNFGFRRSDESMSVREGRQKTPATGNALLLGTAVEFDPAKPGFLKQSAADAAPATGLYGLLVQEESHLGSVFEASPFLGHDSYDLGLAKLDQLSTIWSGAGVKVWYRNTDAYSRGGRAKAAVEMVTETGLVIGDKLGWDGAKWVKVDGATIHNEWMRVALVSPDYVEAVLTF